MDTSLQSKAGAGQGSPKNSDVWLRVVLGQSAGLSGAPGVSLVELPVLSGCFLQHQEPYSGNASGPACLPSRPVLQPGALTTPAHSSVNILSPAKAF